VANRQYISLFVPCKKGVTAITNCQEIFRIKSKQNTGKKIISISRFAQFKRLSSALPMIAFKAFDDD